MVGWCKVNEQTQLKKPSSGGLVGSKPNRTFLGMKTLGTHTNWIFLSVKSLLGALRPDPFKHIDESINFAKKSVFVHTTQPFFEFCGSVRL